MTTFRNLAAAAGLLAFSATPSFAQETTPAQPAQQPSGMTESMREEMRGMMRSMMQDMMMQDMMRQDRPGDERDADRRWGRQRDEDRMGRRGMREGRHWGGDFGHGRRGAMHTARMKVMLAVMDSDGDGALSLEEIRTVQARVFDAVDDDGDGRVTMEEIRFFFHGGRGEQDR
jgi:hypothetical protein